MAPPKRALLALGALAAPLLLSSCFEPPVREDLLLRFLANGAVVATSTVRLADADNTNPALARRLAEERRSLLAGDDAWGGRFAAAEPAAERFSWEKRLGDLRSATRSALLAEPAGLEAFFRDTSLSVRYSVERERGVAELAVVPGASTRASRRERERLARAMDAWTADVADYLAATRDLYAYLDEHPQRDRACFAALFSDDKPKTKEELTTEEARKVETLDAALQKVVDVLLVPAGEDSSLDEISHRVYDPFPARLTVKLPAAPTAVEGFQRGEDGAFTVAGPGLWEALRALEGRWVSPDPALLYVESSQQGADFDLDAFLQKRRRAVAAHHLPSARELKAAVEARLKPAPLYQATWAVRPGDDPGDFRWEESAGAP